MVDFAQITDLHIDNEDQVLTHLNSRANSMAVLDCIQHQNIPRIILTGDIAESERGVRWFFHQISQRNMTYHIVMGNHDDVRSYEKEGLIQHVTPYYALEIENFLLLFLDSTRYYIDPAQLTWMDTQLASHDQDVLLFIHHPVLDCGGSVMDQQYPLKNRDDVAKLLHARNHHISIFCGHYHTEETVESRNIVQFVTPSTLYQLKKYAAGLEIDNERIGYRVLSLDHGTYSTEVKYLEKGNPPGASTC